jgi:hypothetical protein
VEFEVETEINTKANERRRIFGGASLSPSNQRSPRNSSLLERRKERQLKS